MTKDDQVLRAAYHEAVLHLASLTGSEFRARSSLNVAMLVHHADVQISENYGWEPIIRRQLAENRRHIKALSDVADDVLRRTGDDVRDDELLEEHTEARDLWAELEGPLTKAIDFYRAHIDGARSALSGMKKEVRGQAPLHRRLDALAELWAKEGGEVSATAQSFRPFLKAASRDLWQNEDQIISAIRSAIRRYNTRHGIRARRGRRAIGKKV